MLIFTGDRLAASFLEVGLNKYFGLGRPAEILFVGHSHTDSGVRTELVEGALNISASKYAMSGTNTLDRYTMVKQFFSSQQIPPALVVYDVDQNTFNAQLFEKDSFKLLYPFIDDKDIDEYITKRAGEKKRMVLNCLKSLRYNTWLMNLSVRSHLGQIKKYFNVLTENSSKSYDCSNEVKLRIDSEAEEIFTKTIHFILSHGSKVLLLYVPIVDYIKLCDEDGNKSIIKKFLEITKKHPEQIFFADYNQKYQNYYGYFKDADHLNFDGSVTFTKDVVLKIKNIRNGDLP